MTSCRGGPASGPAGAAVGGGAPCAVYADVPNAWGYCVYSRIRSVRSMDSAVALCQQAGAWEQECRHSWVSAYLPQGSGVATDDLLAACGSGDDCALEVLDVRADPDLATQFQRCLEHAGRFGDDCAGHALERWWVQGPDAGELARVAALQTPYPERVAFFISASVVCFGVGSCEGEPRMQAFCEKSSDTFRRDRMRCPGRARPTPLGGAPPKPRR